MIEKAGKVKQMHAVMGFGRVHTYMAIPFIILFCNFRLILPILCLEEGK